MKLHVMTVSAAVLAIMLCGCSEIVTEETDSSAVTITLGENVFNDNSDYPVYAGSLMFEAPPERVVSLSPAATEIIFEAGGGGHIAAVGKYCDYPDEVDSLPKTGSAANPDIEGIISFSPDLVISESPISNKDITDLSDAGVRVLILETPENSGELYDEYLTISALFGGNVRSEENASAMMQRYSDAVSSAEKNMGKLVLIMDNNFSTATGDTLAGDFMKNFGDNIAEIYTDYYMPSEDIIAADPDTIFISENVDRDRFAETFGGLSAVLNGRVFAIDTVHFERPTARLSETAEAIKALPGIN